MAKSDESIEAERVEDEASVRYFKEGLEELLQPHLETCSADVASVIAAQTRLSAELARMENALLKLGDFRAIPKLSAYFDKVKLCRKRLANIQLSLSTIQGRIKKMKEIQQLKLQG
ncbi:MAG: hypothetical protein EZS28_028541 [Streblomastix strix]|uniref:Biogenesis of lysosome-related organelles complex 1 subunit 7 n=1 Tax=Streblomastix strix TaxID=222440 RepID=A0A5J4V0L3_9EUKA|nr:MAG: hypothetical protein EZS28_028541 [Streblomastix strix]